VQAGQDGAHALAEQDVPGPADGGGPGERDPDRIEVPAEQRGPAAGEEHDAEGGQGDPYQVPRPAEAERRHGERAAELDGDGDAEGDPLQGAVERQVHDCQDGAERQQRPQLRTLQPADGRPGHGDEQCGGGHEPQGDGAGRADRREELLRQRRAHLDRCDGAQHEDGGPGGGGDAGGHGHCGHTSTLSGGGAFGKCRSGGAYASRA
jgi:hypothetical protein